MVPIVTIIPIVTAGRWGTLGAPLRAFRLRSVVVLAENNTLLLEVVQFMFTLPEEVVQFIFTLPREGRTFERPGRGCADL